MGTSIETDCRGLLVGNGRGGSRGLTLIELLIVVAIVAVLAAIAVPNFLEAQARAKVSRVKADFAGLATALETYFVDFNTYPPDGNGGFYRGVVALTTPVAYFSSIPRDPFNQGYRDGYAANPSTNTEVNTARFYELGTGSYVNAARGFPAQCWALVAYGPDSDDDTDTIGAFPYTRRACPYDPTNGTVSNGDLYRMAPKPALPNFESDANPEVF